MNAQRVLITGTGELFFVYSDDDRMRRVMQRLGQPDVQRISDVEFNPATGKWEAIVRNGETVSVSSSRAEAVAGEVNYLAGHLREVLPHHGTKPNA